MRRQQKSHKTGADQDQLQSMVQCWKNRMLCALSDAAVASSTTTLSAEFGIRGQRLQKATQAASEAEDNGSKLLQPRRKSSPNSYGAKHVN